MWKKTAFGVIVSVILSGGVVWYNTTPRNVITVDDQARVLDYYAFLCATVAPWPFTSNGVAGVSFGSGNGYEIDQTNFPAGARSWSFAKWGNNSNRVPVVGLNFPLASFRYVMTNLPMLCTNFVMNIGTNTDGTTKVDYWTWTSLCARAGIGNKTSLWTVAVTSGVPVYGEVPLLNINTVLLNEIWRAETNLNTTIRIGAYNPIYTEDSYRFLSRMRDNQVVLGDWYDIDWGPTDLPTYDICGKYEYSTDKAVPSDILIPEGMNGDFSSLAISTWDVRNVFTNATVGGKIPWGDGSHGTDSWSPAGQYYRNYGSTFSHVTLRYQRFVTQYPVIFYPDYDGTYEAIFTEDHPSGWNLAVTKTNFYRFPIARFPSNISLSASVVSACALDFTNISGFVRTTAVTSQWVRVTGASGDGYNGPTNGTTFESNGEAIDQEGNWYFEVLFDWHLYDDPAYAKGWLLSQDGYPVTATPDTDLYPGTVGTFQLEQFDHVVYTTSTNGEGFVITNRINIFTGAASNIVFSGDLATGVFYTLELAYCPQITNAMSASEMQCPVQFKPMKDQQNPFVNPYYYPEGVSNNMNKVTTAIYDATNVIFYGQYVGKGDPICVLKWEYK